MLCYAMLCCAMLCCAMLCYAMLCYAMLCYAMLCHAMLCSQEDEAYSQRLRARLSRRMRAVRQHMLKCNVEVRIAQHSIA